MQAPWTQAGSESVGCIPQISGGEVDGVLEVPILSLEVMGREVHALGPHDFGQELHVGVTRPITVAHSLPKSWKSEEQTKTSELKFAVAHSAFGRRPQDRNQLETSRGSRTARGTLARIVSGGRAGTASRLVISTRPGRHTPGRDDGRDSSLYCQERRV